MKRMLLAVAFLSALGVANAAMHTETVLYKDGKTNLKGYLAYDDSFAEKRPGVIVVHEWMGLDANAKKHAEDVAALGYVAFAADIYGEGKTAANTDEAGKLSSIYKTDRKLMRSRMDAALKTLRGVKAVDPNNVAAIGYCFGGTCVLELARSGADLKGVVTFHGGLSTPTPDDAKNIKAKVLVLHGADDFYVKPEEVAAFEQEMKKGNVDWQLVKYSGAVHGFTNPNAGDNVASGYAYNEKAASRSWVAMMTFFSEIFPK